MIRRLIILLLIVGCVFGDTIEYQKKILGAWQDETIYYVDIVKIEAGNVWYKKRTLLGKKMDRIQCEDIYSIIDSHGNTLDFSCSTNSIKNAEEIISEGLLDNSSRLQPKISGIFFALGGTILYINVDRECDDCDSLKESENFRDSTQGIQKIGYGCILIGGILLAFGI